MAKVMNYLIPCISSVFKAEHFKKELQTKRYLYQADVEHSFDGILVTDLAGKVSYVNCPLEISLKTKAFNLRGKSFYAIWNRINFPAAKSDPSINIVSDLKDNFKEYN